MNKIINFKTKKNFSEKEKQELNIDDKKFEKLIEEEKDNPLVSRLISEYTELNEKMESESYQIGFLAQNNKISHNEMLDRNRILLEQSLELAILRNEIIEKL